MPSLETEVALCLRDDRRANGVPALPRARRRLGRDIKSVRRRPRSTARVHLFALRRPVPYTRGCRQPGAQPGVRAQEPASGSSADDSYEPFRLAVIGDQLRRKLVKVLTQADRDRIVAQTEHNLEHDLASLPSAFPPQ